MNIITGNLLGLADQGVFDVIVHGCNCKGVMGAGIAKQIADRYPEALIADRGSLYLPDRLGGITVAEVENRFGNPLLIVNAYTQEDFRRTNGNVSADYNAIEKAFQTIAKNFGDKRIGYPKIGAGLARGNWNIISNIIKQQLQGLQHALVVLPGDPDANPCAGVDFGQRY